MASNGTGSEEEQAARWGARLEWVAGFSRSFKLSARQERALQLLVDGKSIKQMATELSISEVTARRHAEELCKKCGTRNQRELLALLTRTLMQEVLSLARTNFSG